MLVASGASRGEAYATIFRPRSTKIETAQRGAAQLAKDKPGINKLIRSLKITAPPSFLTMIAPKARRKRKTQKQKRKKKPEMLYNTEIKTLFYQVRTNFALFEGQRSCRCINENSRFTTDEEGRKYRRRGNSTLLFAFAVL